MSNNVFEYVVNWNDNLLLKFQSLKVINMYTYNCDVFELLVYYIYRFLFIPELFKLNYCLSTNN